MSTELAILDQSVTIKSVKKKRTELYDFGSSQMGEA